MVISMPKKGPGRPKIHKDIKISVMSNYNEYHKIYQRKVRKKQEKLRKNKKRKKN